MKTRFGPFTLDPHARQLLRGPEQIHLSPKAFDLLAALVDARPNVVSKDALQKALWPDTFVAEANLSNLVAEIRQSLGDSVRAPQFIRTVHRFGYAFCGTAATIAAAPRESAPVKCWIESGLNRFPMSRGEYVIGRDPDTDIRLESASVSRRHARIVVTDEGATLEDFGSKNGTYHNDTRVADPVPLRNGDQIRVGSLRLLFNVRASDSTETQVESAL
jgi:DNA-binding winged helix-turn-helix (wHTH) protein